MRVIILGVGDAFTSRSFGSSALILGPHGPVLLDCPDPIHRVIRSACEPHALDIDALKIHDIILTHLHGDHSNGLESFGFHRRFATKLIAPAPPKPRLHLTDAARSRLWEKLAPAMDGPVGGDRPSTLDDYYDLHAIAPETTASVAGLTVQCRFTGHPIPTVGLKISDGSSTLGWSGDTPFEQAHIDWLSDADLIVHESNLGGAHTPIDQLNALPDDLRAKMRLIHLPDDFDHACTDIRPLAEGELIDLT